MAHDDVVLRVGNNSPTLRTSGQGPPGPPGPPVLGVVSVRATFNDADANTGALGLATHYAQIGTMTAPRTLTLSDATKALATSIVPIAFLVMDESGSVTGVNKITLTPESGLINGLSSLDIYVGHGNWDIYTDGTNWFAR